MKWYWNLASENEIFATSITMTQTFLSFSQIQFQDPSSILSDIKLDTTENDSLLNTPSTPSNDYNSNYSLTSPIKSSPNHRNHSILFNEISDKSLNKFEINDSKKNINSIYDKKHKYSSSNSQSQISFGEEYHSYIDFPSVCVQSSNQYISKKIDTIGGGNSNDNIVINEYATELVTESNCLIRPVFHSHSCDIDPYNSDIIESAPENLKHQTLDVNAIRNWKLIEHSNHYFMSSPHEKKTIKEFHNGKWVSEIRETHSVRDIRAYFICEPISNKHEASLSESLESRDIILVAVRMDREISLWIKLQSWICFGRFKAMPVGPLGNIGNKIGGIHSGTTSMGSNLGDDQLNSGNEKYNNKENVVLWNAGSSKLLFDVVLWNQKLTLAFATKENSFYDTMNQFSIEEKNSNYMDKTSNSKTGQLGIVQYDMLKVKKYLENELKEKRNVFHRSKIVLVAPESLCYQSVHDSHLQFVKLNRRGSLIATASSKGTVIRLVKTKTSETILSLRRGTTLAFIHSIAFSPTSRYLCCTSSSLTLHFFDIRQCLENSLQTDQGGWMSLKSWMGNQVYSQCQYKTLKGMENICIMPTDSLVYILDDQGRLTYLNYNSKELIFIAEKSIL